MTIFRGKGDEGDSDRAEEVAGRVRLLSPASSQYICMVSAPTSLGSHDAMDSVPSLLIQSALGYTKAASVKAKHSPWPGFGRPLDRLEPEVWFRVFSVAPGLTTSHCTGNHGGDSTAPQDARS